MAVLVLVATAPDATGQATVVRCREEAAAVRFDHVVIAATDLGSASSTFQDTLGFSLKPGRVHENGLRNVHIRFGNGSALELISPGPGEPDELSEWYRRFLERGDGGAFVALSAGPPDTVLGRLGALAAHAVVLEGRAFDWVSFPEGHPLHPIFFVNVRSRAPDEASQLHHRNGAMGLAEVWIETPASKEISEMLARFASASCGRVEGPDGLTGWGHGLSDGMLVASPAELSLDGSRVRAVVLDAELSLPAVQYAGLWLLWKTSSP